jgi:hypothetical protein
LEVEKQKEILNFYKPEFKRYSKAQIFEIPISQVEKIKSTPKSKEEIEVSVSYLKSNASRRRLSSRSEFRERFIEYKFR